MEKKADFKTMTKKQIVGYIWDYYKFPIIVGTVILIFVVSLIHHYINYQRPVVQVALLNCDRSWVDENGMPDFTDFMEQYEYSLKKEQVTLHLDYEVDLEATDNASMYQFQGLLALITAGGVDLLTADEVAYEFMVQCNAVDSLEEHVSGDFLEKYKEQIVYLPNPDTNELYPAGIRIPENAFMTKYKFYGEDCIIGFGNGGTKDEASLRMLYYILGEGWIP